MKKEEFAAELSSLMYENRISQTELAEKTGLSIPAINNYLHGKRFPNMKTLDKINDVLGSTITIDKYEGKCTNVQDENNISILKELLKIEKEINKLNEKKKKLLKLIS